MTPKNDKPSGHENLDALSSEARRAPEGKATRAYVSPAILSHSGEDILEELGPAQACYPFNSCGITP